MLVLTRKSGEGILIAPEIRITVVEVRGNSVRLGIDAPREMKIHRSEVYDRLKQENLAGTHWTPEDLENLEATLDPGSAGGST